MSMQAMSTAITTMDPPTSISQASRLLSLPAELRNTIYGLVLTTDDHVLCLPHQIGDRTVHRFRVMDPSTSTSSKFNQMKFVCRELNIETSNLIPKTPMLVFPDRKDITECASVTCARFLSVLSLKDLNSLEKIDMTEGVPYNARAFWSQLFDLHGIASLVDFCRANPNITLTVHLRSLDYDDKNKGAVQMKMDTIRLVARKPPTFGRLPAHFDKSKNVLKMAKKWSGYGLTAPAFPVNLILKPMGTMSGLWKLPARHRMPIMNILEDGF